MVEEETISVEPRKYRWIEFGDGVDGKVLASSLSEDNSKRIMTIEMDDRILNELILTGKLKRTEIIDENRIKTEIPDEYCRDILYLTCNPKIRADCDFRGKPIPGVTSRWQTELKMADDENRILQLQVLDLQDKLKESTSDTERYVKRVWDAYVKKHLDDLKAFVPSRFPVPKSRKRSFEPV